MNPVDLYVKPWTGWDEAEDQEKEQQQSCNPFLDQFWDTVQNEVKDMAREPFKDFFCKTVIDEAVDQGLIDKETGKAILPVVELVYDKVTQYI